MHTVLVGASVGAIKQREGGWKKEKNNAAYRVFLEKGRAAVPMQLDARGEQRVARKYPGSQSGQVAHSV